MKRNKFLLLFLLNLMWSPTFSNEDCINDLSNKKTEFKENDLVFLGKIADYEETDRIFNFEILETYKGFHPSDEIKIKFIDNNGESIYHYGKMNGYWIIYANRTGINTATTKFCGASRNFQNRTYLNKLPPPPEFFKSKKDSLEHYIQIEKLITKHQQEWINEILELKEKERNWSFLWISGILLSVILNIILIRKLRKKASCQQRI